MRTTNLYIVKQIFAPFVAATAIALLALLLERMLRVMDKTVGSGGSIYVILKMLVNLIPHYLAIALPAAFFLAILLAFNRMSKDSELTALKAAGVALHRLLIPVTAVAAAIMILTAAIVGLLQPYGRYAYRSLVYSVTHASLKAALEEGAFVDVDGMTFMAERVSDGGRRLRKVFVYETEADGTSTATTAPEGALFQSGEDLRPVLHLGPGSRVAVDAGGRNSRVLSFNEFNWPLGQDGRQTFRERGDDERELTLFELWSARHAPPEGSSAEEVVAEFHARLVRVVSILCLPLLAVPLGLQGVRGRRFYGIGVGLLLLALYQKLLQFGESLVALGHVPAWLGLWLPFLAFAAGSAHLFLRADLKVEGDPLARLVEWLAETLEAGRRAMPRSK